MKNTYSSGMTATTQNLLFSSSIPLFSSPIEFQQTIYSPEALQKHLSSLTIAPTPTPSPSPHNFTHSPSSSSSSPLHCICPSSSPPPPSQLYALSNKTRHLQNKIASMKKMLLSQSKKIEKIRKYKEEHELCGDQCCKKKYLELLRNTTPQ